MSTYVVESAQHRVPATDKNQPLARDFDERIRAGLREVGLARDAQPSMAEPGAPLEVEHGRVMEHAWWQQLGALDGPTSRLELGRRGNANRLLCAEVKLGRPHAAEGTASFARATYAVPPTNRARSDRWSRRDGLDRLIMPADRGKLACHT